MRGKIKDKAMLILFAITRDGALSSRRSITSSADWCWQCLSVLSTSGTLVFGRATSTLLGMRKCSYMMGELLLSVLNVLMNGWENGLNDGRDSNEQQKLASTQAYR